MKKQRIIKFRAYDTIEKRMFEVADLNFENGIQVYELDPVTKDSLVHHPNPCILMQSTGLCDWQGKEIYEGDVLQLYRSGDIKIRKQLVEWKNAMQYTGLNTGIGQKTWRFGKEMGHYKKEVIGNIYENPRECS